MSDKTPAPPGIRAGDFDNGIIIHEYGHGISNRLTGGPGVNCLGGTERMSEGWSDYYAITMLTDPELDDPEAARGMGPYALFQDDRHGAGIRPRPYSRTWEIQPFSYDSIRTGGWLGGASLAAPHGVGHGWASVLWDMNWDLIDKHGFNPNLYEPWHTGGNNLALQLVTDGLKFQGCNPTFVVARNAILAADQALTGGENQCTIWASFARRGLGFSAVGGGTSRADGTEAFDTHPDCAAGFTGQVADQPAVNTVAAGRTAAAGARGAAGGAAGAAAGGATGAAEAPASGAAAPAGPASWPPDAAASTAAFGADGVEHDIVDDQAATGVTAPPPTEHAEPADSADATGAAGAEPVGTAPAADEPGAASEGDAASTDRPAEDAGEPDTQAESASKTTKAEG